MDNPIGSTVGNALEIAEAIDCMKGGGPATLKELVCALGILHIRHRELSLHGLVLCIDV